MTPVGQRPGTGAPRATDETSGESPVNSPDTLSVSALRTEQPPPWLAPWLNASLGYALVQPVLDVGATGDAAPDTAFDEAAAAILLTRRLATAESRWYLVGRRGRRPPVAGRHVRSDLGVVGAPRGGRRSARIRAGRPRRHRGPGAAVDGDRGSAGRGRPPRRAGHRAHGGARRARRPSGAPAGRVRIGCPTSWTRRGGGPAFARPPDRRRRTRSLVVRASVLAALVGRPSYRGPERSVRGIPRPRTTGKPARPPPALSAAGCPADHVGPDPGRAQRRERRLRPADRIGHALRGRPARRHLAFTTVPPRHLVVGRQRVAPACHLHSPARSVRRGVCLRREHRLGHSVRRHRRPRRHLAMERPGMAAAGAGAPSASGCLRLGRLRPPAPLGRPRRRVLPELPGRQERASAVVVLARCGLDPVATATCTRGVPRAADHVRHLPRGPPATDAGSDATQRHHRPDHPVQFAVELRRNHLAPATHPEVSAFRPDPRPPRLRPGEPAGPALPGWGPADLDMGRNRLAQTLRRRAAVFGRAGHGHHRRTGPAVRRPGRLRRSDVRVDVPRCGRRPPAA